MPLTSEDIAVITAEAEELAATVKIERLQYLLEITKFHREFLLKELNKRRCAFVLEKKYDLERTMEGLRFLRTHIRWRKRHGLIKAVSHYAETLPRAGQLRDSERAQRRKTLQF
jgi:hypothetical protein